MNRSSSTDHTRHTNTARSNAMRTDVRGVSLKVVPVKVKAPDGDKEIETYAFLDDGSDTTMCLQSLADDLGIEGKPVQFVLSTMPGDQERQGRELCLDVTGMSTGKGVRMSNVWTTDRLPISEENIVAKRDVCEMDHLKDIDIIELPERKITLLIGSDTPEALCPLEVRSGKRGEPYALRTILGWMVTGPLKKGSVKGANMNFIHVDQSIGCEESEVVLTNIHDDFVRMYNSEFSECTAEVRECLSVQDKHAKEIMDQTIKFVNDHYQVRLPWKYERPELPNNKSMAVARLMLSA